MKKMTPPVILICHKQIALFLLHDIFCAVYLSPLLEKYTQTNSFSDVTPFNFFDFFYKGYFNKLNSLITPAKGSPSFIPFRDEVIEHYFGDVKSKNDI